MDRYLSIVFAIGTIMGLILLTTKYNNSIEEVTLSQVYAFLLTVTAFELCLYSSYLAKSKKEKEKE